MAAEAADLKGPTETCASEFGFLLFPGDDLGGRGLRVEQRQRCPTGAGGGDPLMVAVGEAAFEVRLERVRVCLDIPASIGKLCLEQPGDALLIGRRGWFHIGSGMKSVEGEAGGVSVRRHIRELRPASIAVLAGEEIIDRRFDGRLGGGETDQAHGLFFDAAGRLRAEPRAGVIEPGGDFRGAA